MSRMRDLDKLVSRTVEAFGRIDILVNNAGICPRTPLEEITEEEWDRVLAVNLKGAFFLYQKALPWLERKPGGCVVNIASGAGKIGGVQVGAHYSASKAGLICLTKTMALHGARYGIRANAVCPGVIGTEMVTKLSRRQILRYKKMIPLGRIGSERDVAGAVLFLVSEAAGYITGEILDVNGGFIMD
ncbi:MAG: 3-oxoacyl-(acyl-carrier-protein) reductase FabG [Planctomycetes bacterium ADurb.Bin412]|nr:MAG: 3-oxoacyl-(acyl-carrier-protein) reductase FabG [Planctomycetes bacterium ADurb.Bin412]